MQCLYPMKRWIVGKTTNVDGEVIDKGIVTSYDLDFVKTEFGAITREYQEIPCGKCIACRLNYAKDWATRCVLEAKKYEHNEMLTLTYDDEHLPKNKGVDFKTGEILDVVTLCKEDVQKFLKRLRKAFSGVRYFMCGEYGSIHERPHYHLILFNIKVEDKTYFDTNKKGNIQQTSPTIKKIWGKGLISLCPVNYETCEYVARYIMKKQKGKHSKELYEVAGKVAEYTAMSRRPGIAFDYYEEFLKNDYEKKKTYLATKNGLKQVKNSRYFDKLYDIDNPEDMARIKEKRKEDQIEAERTMLSRTELNKQEYLQVRGENLLARLSKKRRKFETG